MSKTLYRIKDLASTANKRGVVPYSSASIWRLVKLEQFPKPFKLGEMCTVWDSADIDQWIDQQKAADLVYRPQPMNNKPKE